MPIAGADAVAGLLSAALGNLTARSAQPALVNGHPALILRFDGEIDGVIAARIDDGLITGIYSVRNPQKLSRLQRETALHH